jgi:hypothetical protein
LQRIRTRHISPDGNLNFVVVASGDGEISLGFEGFPWHTHADILAALTGLPEEDAIDEFVAKLISNELIVVILRENSIVTDVWIEDPPFKARQFDLSESESVQYRYWDGRVICFSGGSDIGESKPGRRRP